MGKRRINRSSNNNSNDNDNFLPGKLLHYANYSIERVLFSVPFLFLPFCATKEACLLACVIL